LKGNCRAGRRAHCLICRELRGFLGHRAFIFKTGSSAQTRTVIHLTWTGVNVLGGSWVKMDRKPEE
jgi:hypothetical protein